MASTIFTFIRGMYGLEDLLGASFLLTYIEQQRIYEIMVNEIVPEQSKDFQGRLLDAAHSWRLPYWDWAKNPRIPRWFRSPVFTPPRWGGPSISKKLPNPLYKFKMPHGKKMAAYGVGSLATEDGKLEVSEWSMPWGLSPLVYFKP